MGLTICLKNPRTIPNHMHIFFSTNQPFAAARVRRYVLADSHPSRCHTLRKYSRIITYPFRISQILLGINLPYLAYTCFYHGHEPTVQSCPNALQNMHGDMHATIKVNVHFKHERYQSNGDTFDTNPLRIIRTTLRIFQYCLYKTYCQGA